MKTQLSKTILMVALEFPPCQSAGVQRTLKFAEYLVKFGWRPIVLTVNEDVYSTVDVQVKIPANVTVYRCKSFDASRDFSVKGKYFAWSKVPDRWWSWAISAIPLGKKLINKYNPDVIWSTYPVSTSHYIAYKLHKFSNLPWVSDYRDPLQCRYDNNVLRYSSVAKWIERKTIEHSVKTIFTTERAAQMYRRLYPDEQLSKFVVIENGFDEGNFKEIKVIEKHPYIKFSLLHSGAVYENGRDPTELFNAIAELHKESVLSKENFELIFRGSNRASYTRQLQELSISDLVFFKENVSYKESLAEMAEASGLLLIQGKLFNNQIPGKAYEYIRCQKPILALTFEKGATGHLLNSIEGCHVANGVENIKHAIKKMIMKSDTIDRNVSLYSRQAKTQELAELLDTLC